MLRKRGYIILELCYTSYSEGKRDELYEEILNSLGKRIVPDARDFWSSDVQTED